MGKGIHAMINNQYNNQITLKYKQLISFVKVGSRTWMAQQVSWRPVARGWCEPCGPSKIQKCPSNKYSNPTFAIWEIFQTWHGGRLHPGGHVHQPHGRRGLAHCRQPYQPHACEICHIALYTCLDFLICQVLNSTSHCSSVKYVKQPCGRCTTAQVGQPTPSHGANFNLWASNHLSEFSQFFPLKSLAPFPGGFPLKASTGIHTPSTGRTTSPTELRRLAIFSTKICFHCILSWADHYQQSSVLSNNWRPYTMI